VTEDEPTAEENEERREDDAEARRQQMDQPRLLGENGEPVQIHVVSWLDNTFWRVAVALALASSLFAIYDNGRRVDRLEGQVCESLAISRVNLDTLEYYKEHPDEREDARRNIEADLRRFHCPNPGSPTVMELRANVGMPDPGILFLGEGR
jgi:hypothetical protein